MTEQQVDYAALQRQGQAEAWAGISAYEKAEQEAYDRAQQREQRIAAGFAALGYRQATDGTWRRTGSEQIGGLPAGLVEQAKQAIAAELQAVQTLAAKQKQAEDDIARMGLSGGAAEYHRQVTVGESWRATQEAHTATRRALHDFGEVVEQVREARATLAALPGRTATEARRHSQVEAQIEQDKIAAQLVLQRYGLT